jgi:hypothetical protein
MAFRITLESNNVPSIRVPAEKLWDLVEFLSEQRAAVNYTYDRSAFLVTFPTMTLAAVQRTLTDWLHAAEPAAV